MTERIKRMLSLAIAVALAGCSTINTQIRKEVEREQEAGKRGMEPPLRIAPPARVAEVKGALVPVAPAVPQTRSEWLRKLRIELDVRNPVSLWAVIEKLSGQGINVISDLPLGTYTYVGRVNPTDADTALQAVLGSVGLDFEADDARRTVVIKPMSQRTWYVNIGYRKATFSSDGQAASGAPPAASGAAPGSSLTPGSGMATSAGATYGQTGMAPGGAATPGMSQNQGAPGGGLQPLAPLAVGGTAVTAADDFWTSLSIELTSRLSVLVPKAMVAGIPQGPNLPPIPGGVPVPTPLPMYMSGSVTSGGQSAGESHWRRQIGSYSLNPATGAVTVQAPHWVLSDLDAYFKWIQDMYNTDITFLGELVLVTSTRSDSEGFDLAAFTSWASGRYGAIVSNNALGGVTVTLPSPGVPVSVSAAQQTVGGPLVGLRYQTATDALQIFNAFLSELGKVSVIQRPLVTTTSGVPGVFAKKFTDYYNTVSQQAAAGGTGSAATATQNTLVPVELGTELRINPRIDLATGLIRAQLTLSQSIQSGIRTIPQTITFGNNAQTVNTSIPLITRQNLSGEILLRDGDLIVVGGQTEDNATVNDNGLPGEEGPLGGLFGVKKASRGAQTYYFALRVAVSRRK